MRRIAGLLTLVLCLGAGPVCAQVVPPRNEVAIGPVLTPANHPLVLRDWNGTTLDYTTMMTPETIGPVSRFRTVSVDVDSHFELQEIPDVGVTHASVWEHLPSGVQTQSTTSIVSIP